MNRERTQWERMLPHQFRDAVAALPVVFLPLGTVEWHGEHNALGLDALKAHALCARAAEAAGGGVVHPPLYGGMGGLDKPATVVIEPELAWENYLLRPWLEQLGYEFHRIGFRGIVMLTGHYGHNQQIVVRETAARLSERLRIPVLGTPEYWLAQDVGYQGDHAGVGETSLLWHLHPELVDMTREDGEFDAGSASAERGAQYTRVIVERLAAVARAMPAWDVGQLDAFAAAERALVRVQVRLWREANPWQAWRHLVERQRFDYGRLLAEGDFAGVARLAEALG